MSGSSIQIKCDWSCREEGDHCFFHWHWKPHSEAKDFSDRQSVLFLWVFPSQWNWSQSATSRRKEPNWMRNSLDCFYVDTLTLEHNWETSGMHPPVPEFMTAKQLHSDCLRSAPVQQDRKYVRGQRRCMWLIIHSKIPIFHFQWRIFHVCYSSVIVEPISVKNMYPEMKIQVDCLFICC